MSQSTYKILRIGRDFMAFRKEAFLEAINDVNWNLYWKINDLSNESLKIASNENIKMAINKNMAIALDEKGHHSLLAPKAIDKQTWSLAWGISEEIGKIDLGYCNTINIGSEHHFILLPKTDTTMETIPGLKNK